MVALREINKVKYRYDKLKKCNELPSFIGNLQHRSLWIKYYPSSIINLRWFQWCLISTYEKWSCFPLLHEDAWSFEELLVTKREHFLVLWGIMGASELEGSLNRLLAENVLTNIFYFQWMLKQLYEEVHAQITDSKVLSLTQN